MTKDTLDRQKLRFIDVGGARTRVYADGAGEPLVLFSGGEYGSLYSLDCWSLNLPVLARHFRVYAVDKLGQGHTDNPKTDSDYTWKTLFRHACGVFDAFGIRSAHVAGHSRGALLVARLALERPDLVKTLVIVDSATLAGDPPGFDFYAKIGRPAGRLPKGVTPKPETVRVEPDAQAYSKEQVTDDFIARMVEIALLPKTHEASERMEAVSDNVWVPSLMQTQEATLREIDERGFAVPTLVIWGFDDRSAPLRLGLGVFEHVRVKTREAALHVLNGAGHYSFRDQARAFNRVLPSFCLR